VNNSDFIENPLFAVAENQGATPYDIVIKQELNSTLRPLLGYFNLIPSGRQEVIKDKVQWTNEREADFVAKVYPDQGEPYILHVEYQSTNDAKMVWRMLMYCAFLGQRYHLPVRQYVIYLGQAPLRMSTRIDDPGWLTYQYQALDVRQVPSRVMLEAPNPEDAVLAVLCQFEPDSSSELIRKIIHRFQELGTESLRFQKCYRQLEILSQLRNLNKEVIKTLKEMPIDIDIEKLPSYMMGEKRASRRTLDIFQDLKDGKAPDVIAKSHDVPIEFVLEVQSMLNR